MWLLHTHSHRKCSWFFRHDKWQLGNLLVEFPYFILLLTLKFLKLLQHVPGISFKPHNWVVWGVVDPKSQKALNKVFLQALVSLTACLPISKKPQPTVENQAAARSCWPSQNSQGVPSLKTKFWLGWWFWQPKNQGSDMGLWFRILDIPRKRLAAMTSHLTTNQTKPKHQPLNNALLVLPSHSPATSSAPPRAAGSAAAAVWSPPLHDWRLPSHSPGTSSAPPKAAGSAAAAVWSPPLHDWCLPSHPPGTSSVPPRAAGSAAAAVWSPPLHDWHLPRHSGTSSAPPRGADSAAAAVWSPAGLPSTAPAHPARWAARLATKHHKLTAQHCEEAKQKSWPFLITNYPSKRPQTALGRSFWITKLLLRQRERS